MYLTLLPQVVMLTYTNTQLRWYQHLTLNETTKVLTKSKLNFRRVQCVRYHTSFFCMLQYCRAFGSAILDRVVVFNLVYPKLVFLSKTLKIIMDHKEGILFQHFSCTPSPSSVEENLFPVC